MTKVKALNASNKYKLEAKRTLEDAIDEEPDTVIVLAFWSGNGQFKIKTSPIQDRLTLIGAIEEAKNKVITDGYAG